MRVSSKAGFLRRLRNPRERLDRVETWLEQVASNPDQAIRSTSAGRTGRSGDQRGRIAYSAKERRLDEAFAFWNEADKLYQCSSQTASDLNQR